MLRGGKAPQAPGVSAVELVSPGEGLAGLVSPPPARPRRRSSRTAPALSDATDKAAGKGRIRKAGAQTGAGHGGKRHRGARLGG